MIAHLNRTTTPKMGSKTLIVVGTIENTPFSFGSLPGVNGNPGEMAPKWRITTSDFQKALQDTLAQSGLFKSVGSEGQADYELDGFIFSQQADMLTWDYFLMIGVKYKLVERASGKEIWSGSLFSDCKTGALTSVSPYTECVMRKNLSELLDKLSQL